MNQDIYNLLKIVSHQGSKQHKLNLQQHEKRNDLTAEAEALTAISELGYKKAKLEETKVAQEEYQKTKEETKTLK